MLRLGMKKHPNVPLDMTPDKIREYLSSGKYIPSSIRKELEDKLKQNDLYNRHSTYSPEPVNLNPFTTLNSSQNKIIPIEGELFPDLEKNTGKIGISENTSSMANKTAPKVLSYKHILKNEQNFENNINRVIIDNKVIVTYEEIKEAYMDCRLDRIILQLSVDGYDLDHIHRLHNTDIVLRRMMELSELLIRDNKEDFKKKYDNIVLKMDDIWNHSLPIMQEYHLNRLKVTVNENDLTDIIEEVNNLERFVKKSLTYYEHEFDIHGEYDEEYIYFIDLEDSFTSRVNVRAISLNNKKLLRNTLLNDFNMFDIDTTTYINNLFLELDGKIIHFVYDIKNKTDTVEIFDKFIIENMPEKIHSLVSGLSKSTNDIKTDSAFNENNFISLRKSMPLRKNVIFSSEEEEEEDYDTYQYPDHYDNSDQYSDSEYIY